MRRPPSCSRGTLTEQVIALGPVAVLEPAKNLGTNGGGFFNVNGAHPFETPTPLANLLHMLAIAVLPASLTHTFGRMIGRPRQGWTLFAVMLVLFVAGLLAGHVAEQRGHVLAAQGADHAATALQAGGNMEGKEMRFGIGGSVLAAVATSNGATGSYNSMHDSYTPLGGLVTIVNMLLGEVVFGGLGSGLYSLVLILLVGIFIAGLMIGRTPEYLGKQITLQEMKLVALYMVIGPMTILPLTAVALVTDAGLGRAHHEQGPARPQRDPRRVHHVDGEQRPELRRLSANTPFYNVTTALAMMVGRFGLAIPALGAGRSLRGAGTQASDRGHAAHRHAALRRADDRDDPDRRGPQRHPVLALGPIVEHLALR